MKFISHEDLSRFQTVLATPANAYKCNLWLSRIMHTSSHTHTITHSMWQLSLVYHPPLTPTSCSPQSPKPQVPPISHSAV